MCTVSPLHATFAIRIVCTRQRILFSIAAVATFKVVAANKYKNQERLNEVKQRLK